jgi:DNA-binding CsgD family transcriptional regulator
MKKATARPLPRRLPPEGASRAQQMTVRLTPRQREIATLVARGLVNKEIAGALGISPATVASQLRLIFARAGVDRRAALIHVMWTAGAFHGDADVTLVAPSLHRSRSEHGSHRGRTKPR